MSEPVTFALWAIVIGALLISIVLSGSRLKRLPLSTAMLYLAAGIALGPAGWELLRPNPLLHPVFLQHLSEIAVVISLFAVGLKLGLPITDRRWRLSLRLVIISMSVTVGLIALIGVYGLGLPVGAAILLGGILAPTDPVLASDVQVESAEDRDALRFSLTGEGGLNDGAAMPFVLLGLGLLGLHDIGPFAWRWLTIEVLWAIPAGVLIGMALGTLIGKLVVYLRSHQRESLDLDEFLALGLMALTYGLAELAEANGFLAVFAAGMALQRINVRITPPQPGMAVASSEPAPEGDMDAAHAGKSMTQGVRGFNDQLEHIAEVTVVLAVGAMLSFVSFDVGVMLFVFVLFIVIRPLSVWLGLLGSRTAADQRRLIAWFGIRGIGSVYYLMFAISHGLPSPLAERFITITLTVITASVLLHGISVTPLMALYSRRKARFSIRARQRSPTKARAKIE